MDPCLVEQACSEHLPGDIRTQHRDVLVLSGLFGAPDRSIQVVEGELPPGHSGRP
jgi:hypothetical protein